MEAIDLVKQAFQEKGFSYGLIFMNCSMPIVDGYEASDFIRNFSRKKNILKPMIVACTGHTE
jgi:CheY-like chemotaxis protein